MYLYSDGIPEGLDAELEEYGDTRMMELMDRCTRESIDDSVESICDEILRWCRVNGPKDDISIIGVELR